MEKEKLYQLLYSTDENNIRLGFQMGKGLDWFDEEEFLRKFEHLGEFVFDRKINLEDYIEIMQAEDLCMAGEDLTEVPAYIRHLKNLQVLDFDNNNLSELPDWIGELHNLQELTLINNPLTSLPDGIWELKSLEFLDLSGTKIKHLPEMVTKLANLEELNLNGCSELKTLPENIGQMTTLQGLSLADCTSLQTLPMSICELDLEDLVLEGAKFKALSNDVKNMLAQHFDYTEF